MILVLASTRASTRSAAATIPSTEPPLDRSINGYRPLKNVSPMCMTLALRAQWPADVPAAAHQHVDALGHLHRADLHGVVVDLGGRRRGGGEDEDDRHRKAAHHCTSASNAAVRMRWARCTCTHSRYLPGLGKA